MIPILALLLLAPSGAGPSEPPPEEIRLTVLRDPYTSSDQVTLCRVRADNLGGRRWSGRSIAFEVRVPGASPPVRARGRFGLTLEPYGSLETIVALSGRHDRFEVVSVRARNSGERDSAVRRKHGRARKRSVAEEPAR
ncbi:MAG TPA: hypothetical protein VKG23_19410 [Thermoanaerobaculia bacterium]|nr:hypothetical protein [Thermoanaerobaculia bacterium]